MICQQTYPAPTVLQAVGSVPEATAINQAASVLILKELKDKTEEKKKFKKQTYIFQNLFYVWNLKLSVKGQV